MKRTRVLIVVVCGFVGAREAASATITWDGGGGDFAWQNAANWSGDALPGLNDDVIINVVTNVTITSSASVTIASLQCSNNLALSAGTFRVISGSSLVQGQLIASGNPTLSATGALTSFTVVGPVNADGAGFEAAGGATLSLPTLVSYTKGSGCAVMTWQATGTGSVLDFPSLTNVTGAVCGNLTVQAVSGGRVLLTHLTTVGNGFMSVVADGTNSLVDLPALQQSLATTETVSFEARNRGTVAMPQFPGGTMVTVALKSGGVLPVAQLRQLLGFTAAELTVDFPALTNLGSGNVTVNGGAIVTTPSLVSLDLTGCPFNTWQVSGAGSVLDLSHLISLTGPGCGFMNLRATSGGTMVLSNLVTIPEGTLHFLADGANSLVDLSALQQMLAVSRTVSFEARNNGTLRVPLLAGGPTVTVTLSSGGVLPVAQLGRLSGFTVSGVTTSFPALTNLTGGNVTVNGGAVVALPSLLSLNLAGCPANTWLVSGAGSVLDLSHLTSLTGPGCGFINLWATSGGTMVLSNLVTVPEGTLNFLADGANSLVDLSALQQMLAVSRTTSFAAVNGGTMWMPLLPGGPTVTVTLSSGGVLPVTQLERLNGFTVTGMAVNFSALTNLGNANVTVNGGAIVTTPNLVSLALTGCPFNTWLVSGADSVFDLSHLTSVTGPGCGYLNIQATAGGTMVLSNLAAIPEGTLSFLADGTNSLVDLSALEQLLAISRTVSFEARNNGTMWMPLLAGGPTVSVTLSSGGILPVVQLTKLNGFGVTGMAVDFPALTNLTGGNVTVNGGAVVALPSLLSLNLAGCPANTWLVSGTGSVLDLSHLTSLAGPGCGFINLQAASGGTMVLSNLVAVPEGTLSFLADGANSLVDLGALQQSQATLRAVSFEVRNAGTIRMPLMTGGATVTVTIKTNGVMSVAPMRRLSGINVSAATVNFPALTNIDSGRFAISNGAMVTAPNLRSYARGGDCTPDSWLVSGAGSVLDLSGINQITGGTCAWLDAQALNGGHLLLGNLTNILSGTVYFLASGTGSLIDLHSLINYLNSLKLSRLTATNGGTFLLEEQPFLLSGVTVSFAAGTPGLPQTSLGATNAFLHGNPWHSYWVESRNPASPTNPWAFFQRVPLTNEFQVIGPAAPAKTEFRVAEFVADPFALELTALAGAGVNVVLYGPTNQSFEVLATTNLALPGPWQTTNTVFMTNTFRILPQEPVATSQRFFQVNPR